MKQVDWGRIDQIWDEEFHVYHGACDSYHAAQMAGKTVLVEQTLNGVDLGSEVAVVGFIMTYLSNSNGDVVIKTELLGDDGTSLTLLRGCKLTIRREIKDA